MNEKMTSDDGTLLFSSSEAKIVGRLVQALKEEGGFDLCHALHTSWYNDELLRLKTTNSAAAAVLPPLPYGPALLVGNTGFSSARTFWERFLSWLLAQPKHQNNKTEPDDEIASQSTEETATRATKFKIPKDPVDTYTVEAIQRLVKQHLTTTMTTTTKEDDEDLEKDQLSLQNIKVKIYWAHTTPDVESDNQKSNNQTTHGGRSLRFASMTRLASVSGFSYIHPTAHLSIHPIYGSWHSFRALIVFLRNEDDDNDNDNSSKATTPPPRRLTNPLTPQQDAKLIGLARIAMENHTHVFSSALSLRANRDKEEDDNDDKPPPLSSSFQPWIDLRRAVPCLEQKYEFPEDQLWYHYTKDVNILQSALQKMVQKEHG